MLPLIQLAYPAVLSVSDKSYLPSLVIAITFVSFFPTQFAPILTFENPGLFSYRL
jgi:hypothetical protein